MVKAPDPYLKALEVVNASKEHGFMSNVQSGKIKRKRVKWAGHMKQVEH